MEDKVKKICLVVLVAGFLLSPLMAFADTDFSLGAPYYEPVMMMFLGFGLLGLAEIARDRIKK